MSGQSPSVLIVDECQRRRAIFEAGLRAAGHTDDALRQSIDGIAAEIERTKPHAVIIGLEHPRPAQLDTILQLARLIQRPVAMFVEHSDHASLEGLSTRMSQPISSMA